MTPTGRRRHRILRRLGRPDVLVLQVEVTRREWRWTGFAPPPPGARITDDRYGYDRTWWRNATVSDITEEIAP